MNYEYLQQYCDAWNQHDIDKIMGFMSDDCVFETGGGYERFGVRFRGHDDVRKRFIDVWTEFPDVHFENAAHFIDGNRGCSEWIFVATGTEGNRIEIDGCDLFTFAGDKI